MMNDLDIDDWLATGTAKTDTVTLYNDQAAVAEINDLVSRRDELQRAEQAGTAVERSAAEQSELTTVEERLQTLLDTFEQTATVWTLVPVSADDFDALVKRYPDPVAPRKPLPTDGDAAWTRYEKKLTDFKAESESVDLSRNLEYVAASVRTITQGDSSREGVTVDQLRALRSRANGREQFEALLRAAITVSKGEVNPPLPKF